MTRGEGFALVAEKGYPTVRVDGRKVAGPREWLALFTKRIAASRE